MGSSGTTFSHMDRWRCWKSTFPSSSVGGALKAKLRGLAWILAWGLNAFPAHHDLSKVHKITSLLVEKEDVASGMTLRFTAHKQVSVQVRQPPLALKPMGRVTRSPKWGKSVAPQNWPWSNNFFKKKVHTNNFIKLTCCASVLSDCWFSTGGAFAGVLSCSPAFTVGASFFNFLFGGGKFCNILQNCMWMAHCAVSFLLNWTMFYRSRVMKWHLHQTPHSYSLGIKVITPFQLHLASSTFVGFQ